MAFHSFIFMGTNSPVKITNAKSGLIRRLIDVRPSGKKVPRKRYNELMKKIKFELGAIACHCLEVYKEMGENYYDAYIPTEMMAATNDFYDFIEHNFDKYKEAEFVTLSEAWKSYGEYTEFANAYKLSYRIFRTELRNYFRRFEDSVTIDGKRIRNVYFDFRVERFEKGEMNAEQDADNNGNSGGSSGDRTCSQEDPPGWLTFEDLKESGLGGVAWDWPAQYETDYGKGEQPEKAWAKCITTLKDLDTSKCHYLNPPTDIPIVMIDFDLKDESGNKCLEKNLRAASFFPPTYAELSKSGQGIHLYYFWEGCDLGDLSFVYSEGIEIKVFDKEGSAIRRKLTKCNRLPVATLSSGLPTKGDKKKVVNWEGIQNEKMLRTMISKNLRKEYHSDTSSSINYINHLLDEAYESGIPYNVTDLRQQVLIFAMKSTNQSDRCCAVVANMKFASKDQERGEIDYTKYRLNPEGEERKKIVLDIEIYRPDPDPDKDNEGLFLVCYKVLGTDLTPASVTAMLNPKAFEVQDLIDKYDIIGFNILEYDCHMLWAATRGDSNEQLYQLSHAMINMNRNDVKSWEAKKMVYCDVYEYTKAAGEGMGLKKWEIKLSALAAYSDEELEKKGYNKDQIKAISVFRGGDATHKEMDIPWDQPAPKEKWDEIVRYCKNDVLATEAVYWFTQNYFKARLFQVDLVHALHGENVAAFPRDTANQLSKRIIFGSNRHPQDQFNYRDLSLPVGSDRYEEYLKLFGEDYHFRVWNEKGEPEFRDYIPGEVLPDGWSILPFFPGYVFDQYAPKGKKSFFMDDYGGEGGRTFSRPGIWLNVYDGDIISQYPHSIMAEMLFGPKYTRIFREIVQARVAIKHKDFETAGKLLNGALKPYLNDESAKDLAQALKIIINAIYGLTSASFENEFRDDRNKDNIVAKRGNLFMMVLKIKIEEMVYVVCHIKTDSIKVANADQKVKDFIFKFGKEYGYTFETEAEFTKFALLNDAAYVGKLIDGSWSFKADEFKHPFVRKTLFTKEPLIFDDYCMTFSTKDALYLDMNEGYRDVLAEEKRFGYLDRKLKKEEIPKGFNSLDEVEKEMGELDAIIRQSHNLKFVGKTGQFTPVKEGTGGGILYRVNNGKCYAVGGTDGYRWLESETVIKEGLQDRVDLDYFRKLVDKAKDDISSLPGGNFEWFVADDDFMNIPEGVDQEVSFD
jgi:hypothetical protein